MNIHLVLYSNNEPFDTTKKLTIESVSKFTTNNIIIHDYDLEKIKQTDWFESIQNLPTIHRDGRRDGYYNCWKSFITRDVYNEMKEGDILYYVDCSQYFQIGFTENIDKLCAIAHQMLRICGSMGRNVKNNSNKSCDNLTVWNKIIPNEDNTVHLQKMHVLNSWFLFKKCQENDGFINDWVRFSTYTDSDIEDPMVTYHHTADQSIFNILVVKYGFSVFYRKPIVHDSNKNKNLVLKIINNGKPHESYFSLPF
jgi:hypothetical protein